MKYIGVIVKVGKIKQDHSDVERKIRECGIERKIEGGKKEVHLTEVWVISSGSITENAKRKIYHDYKSLSIEFIDGTGIAALICIKNLCALIKNSSSRKWQLSKIEQTEQTRNPAMVMIDKK